jgi:hypothetical protein
LEGAQKWEFCGLVRESGRVISGACAWQMMLTLKNTPKVNSTTALDKR